MKEIVNVRSVCAQYLYSDTETIRYLNNFWALLKNVLIDLRARCVHARHFAIDLVTPLPPCLFCSTPPSPHQGTFVLARSFLFPSIYIFVKFREKELRMSISIFGLTQRIF